jgi:hypothetical protein
VAPGVYLTAEILRESDFEKTEDELFVGNASLIGGVRSCGRERSEGGDHNAKAQSRREEEKEGLVVAWGGMGILPMTSRGRPARPVSRGVLWQAGTPVPCRKLGGFPLSTIFPANN